MMLNDQNTTIRVDHVSKFFRIYKDKSHTFKDRVLFHKRSQYDENKVLNDISFTVKKGEAVGLIGHNGCGKSTTLKLLNRILYPEKGIIEMKGRISSLIELGAGFHPDMTGRENIYINATIFGLKKHEIDERLDEIIRFSELERFIDSPVRTYSSGMYMRLAFAIAINVDADILLVDEILAVGDANFQQKCFNKMQQIKESGTTIVIVSHSMEQIKSICDRTLWIDHGEIREQGPADVVCDHYLHEMAELAEERNRVEEREREEAAEPVEDPEPTLEELFPPKNISAQACEHARRRGDMRVRYRSITLCDDDGRECDRFAYGESLVIRYEVTSEEVSKLANESLQVELQVRIFTRNGILCSWFSTMAHLRELREWQEFSKGTFRIPSLQYAPGEYNIDIAIVGEDAHEYDLLLHFLEFEIEGDMREGLGIAAMDNVWTYEA